jgi:hypothetical protein
MQAMPVPAPETLDLLDLKLLPAWVREPAEPRSYADTEDDRNRDREQPMRQRRGGPRRDRNRPSVKADRPFAKRGRGAEHDRGRPKQDRNRLGRGPQRDGDRHVRDRHAPITPPPQLVIRFQAYGPAFENVVAQINSGSVAYSLFALARLFLEKPVGYEVFITAKAESPVYQLGDNGVVSVDREFLERNGFRFAQRDFFQIEVIEAEPIKGNFSNVARCRLSGTFLGPTNHHNYQPQLRSLYEQRFSRRMSFADFQRQIEIVSDPSLIERWKDEARKTTIYTALREEAPVKFSSAAEAERHFRSHHLPGLIRALQEAVIGGTPSRRMHDRVLGRMIEEAWMRETRSPSKMMQELAGRFRQNGLHVFRHRRGMLFVSPIRPRMFVHEHAGVSSSVNAILEAIRATPGMNRKQLLEKLITDSANDDAEARRLALASDLRWLIDEGYVIEFNDGSLDLPRGKSQSQEPVAAIATASGFSTDPGVDTTAATTRWPLQLTWREP